MDRPVTAQTTVREAITAAAADHAAENAARTVTPAPRPAGPGPHRGPSLPARPRPAPTPAVPGRAAVNGAAALRTALNAGRILLVLTPTHRLAQDTLDALGAARDQWISLISPGGARQAAMHGKPGTPLLRLWGERQGPTGHHEMGVEIERMATVGGWVRVTLDDVAAVMGRAA